MLYSVACSDLQDLLRRFLSELMSLEEFEEGFINSLQDYLDSGDPACVSLANEISAILIESTLEPLEEHSIKNSLYKAMCPNGEPLIFETMKSSNVTIWVDDTNITPTIIEQVNFAGAGTSR